MSLDDVRQQSKGDDVTSRRIGIIGEYLEFTIYPRAVND